MGKAAHIFFILALATTNRLTAQSPRVVELSAFCRDSIVVVRAIVDDLFPVKIANTIRSGLPAIVYYEYRLTKPDGQIVLDLTRVAEVVYDLWSQRFRVRYAGSERAIESFEAMKSMCSHIENERIASAAKLDSVALYQVRLRVAVSPIIDRVHRQIQTQLESTNLRDPNAASESSSSGFSLNVSRLLAMFWGERRRNYGASDWVSSPPFRIVPPP